MNASYHKQVETINAAAAFFATLGYRVDITYHANRISMYVTIYFNDATLKSSIKKYLKCYADEDDSIEFREHKLGENSKFYTLRLIKNPS